MKASASSIGTRFTVFVVRSAKKSLTSCESDFSISNSTENLADSGPRNEAVFFVTSSDCGFMFVNLASFGILNASLIDCPRITCPVCSLLKFSPVPLNVYLVTRLDGCDTIAIGSVSYSTIMFPAG